VGAAVGRDVGVAVGVGVGAPVIIQMPTSQEPVIQSEPDRQVWPTRHGEQSSPPQSTSVSSSPLLESVQEIDVGVVVGTAVGAGVGVGVGAQVVGTGVGDGDGISVGAAVGDAVGENVAHTRSLLNAGSWISYFPLSQTVRVVQTLSDFRVGGDSSNSLKLAVGSLSQSDTV